MMKATPQPINVRQSKRPNRSVGNKQKDGPSVDGQINEFKCIEEGYNKNLFHKTNNFTLSIDSNNNRDQFDFTSERIEDILNISIENKITPGQATKTKVKKQAAIVFKNKKNINEQKALNSSRPPLQKQPFSAVRKKAQDSKLLTGRSSQFTSISPIRANENTFNFVEKEKHLYSTLNTGQKGKNLTEDILDDSLRKLDSQFSEEENSIITKLTPLKSNTSGKKSLHFAQKELSVLNNSQSGKNNKSYIRRMILQNDILANNEDKIDFLIGEIETAHAKITLLESKLNGDNQTDISNQIKLSKSKNNSKSSIVESYVKSSNFESDCFIKSQNKMKYDLTAVNHTPKAHSEFISLGNSCKSTEGLKTCHETSKYQTEIKRLTFENSRLKEVILKRTEEANETIMKLAKMK